MALPAREDRRIGGSGRSRSRREVRGIWPVRTEAGGVDSLMVYIARVVQTSGLGCFNLVMVCELLVHFAE